MDGEGRIIGLIVFSIGIALLIITFYIGLSFLIDPRRLAAFAELIPEPKDLDGVFPGISIIITRVIAYVIPVLLIFVLGYIASKVISQGIIMYRHEKMAEYGKER